MTCQIRDKKTMKPVREYFDFSTFEEVMDYFASEWFLRGVRFGQWDLDDFIITIPHCHIAGKDCHQACVAIQLPYSEVMYRCNSCGNPAPMSLEEVMQHVKDTQHYRMSSERYFKK